MEPSAGAARAVNRIADKVEANALRRYFAVKMKSHRFGDLRLQIAKVRSSPCVLMPPKPAGAPTRPRAFPNPRPARSEK